MTIAFVLPAILDNDLVMAADTQETFGGHGDTKLSQPKIVTFLSPVQFGSIPPVPQNVCAIVGAGDAAYVDAITEDLAGAYLEHSAGADDLKQTFGKCVRDFHINHVVPFLALPANERPDVELLIAAQHNGTRLAFATTYSTMRTIPLFQAIGIGAPLAKTLLNRFWKPAGTRDAQILAAYIAYLVKESVEGCGKLTQIVTLHGSKLVQSGGDEPAQMIPPSTPFTQMPWHEVEELESTFRHMWSIAEREVVWNLIADWKREHPTGGTP